MPWGWKPSPQLRHHLPAPVPACHPPAGAQDPWAAHMPSPATWGHCPQPETQDQPPPNAGDVGCPLGGVSATIRGQRMAWVSRLRSILHKGPFFKRTRPGHLSGRLSQSSTGRWLSLSSGRPLGNSKGHAGPGRAPLPLPCRTDPTGS